MNDWTADEINPRQLWVREQAKKAFENTVPTLNDYLGRLLTLSTALAGGSFLLAKQALILQVFVVSSLVVLLFAMGISAFGLMPTPSKMWSPFHNTDDFEDFEKGLIQKKSACVWIAAGALFVAVLIGGFGLVFGPPAE